LITKANFRFLGYDSDHHSTKTFKEVKDKKKKKKKKDVKDFIIIRLFLSIKTIWIEFCFTKYWSLNITNTTHAMRFMEKQLSEYLSTRQNSVELYYTLTHHTPVYKNKIQREILNFITSARIIQQKVKENTIIKSPIKLWLEYLQS